MRVLQNVLLTYDARGFGCFQLYPLKVVNQTVYSRQDDGSEHCEVFADGRLHTTE